MMRNSVVFAFVLCCTVAHVSTTLLLTTTGTIATITGATLTTSALSAIVGAKALGALAVAKGAIVGHALNRRRHGGYYEHHYYKRSVAAQQEQEDSSVLMMEVAQQMDTAGCVAKLLCELEAMPVEQLSPSAVTLKTAFSGSSKLKTGVYNVAYNFGSKLAKNSPKACELVFSECPLTKSELLSMLETTFTC